MSRFERTAVVLKQAISVSSLSGTHAAIAKSQLFMVARRLCMWSAYVENITADVVKVAFDQSRGHLDALGQTSLPVDPYLALSVPLSPSEFLSVARHYASLTYFAPPLYGSASLSRLPPSITVAYTSSEFGRRHSIMLLMSSVFRTHKRVTPVCFGLQRPHPGVPLPGCRGGFVDVSGDSDTVAAQRINAATAHVLVDLNGWTAGHRASVVAARPCVVQVPMCVRVRVFKYVCIVCILRLPGYVL
jgi:hypothetical protein